MDPDQGSDHGSSQGSDRSPNDGSDHSPNHGSDHSPDHLGIVRFAELPVVPWRNGGGVTREVVASGGSGPQGVEPQRVEPEGVEPQGVEPQGVEPQGFDWRISIADVSRPGPFSAFPGVDRVITLIEGERMDLVIDGVVHVLGLHESLSFDGASQASCSLPTGPTRDLNVMTRSDRLSAAVAVRDLSETRPIAVSGSQIVVLLTGSAVVAGADESWSELSPLDAVCPSGLHVRLVTGSGKVAVVRIEDHHPSRAR